MSRFKPMTREMDYLFPPSMNDWLPKHHLARFIVEIVDQLASSPAERRRTPPMTPLPFALSPPINIPTTTRSTPSANGS